MIIRSKSAFFPATLVVCVFIFSGVTSSAQSRRRDRIPRKIEPTSSAVVKGNTHPLANARYDRQWMSITLHNSTRSGFDFPRDAIPAPGLGRGRDTRENENTHHKGGRKKRRF